ncbi:MAG: cyclopropane-fatty-acyl-phospholipid synthase family protein [Acidimicrobiales bacterium]|jgi:cyclopropane-fatty-acyl-phospholipid synthase
MTEQVPPVDASGLLRHAAPRRMWTGLEKTARKVVLAAGARGAGGAIEVVEAGRTHRLGTGDPVARVEVHDPRAYEALLRSGSVGLGASYIAGWWDADDLTAFLREMFSRMRPLLNWMDRLGRAVGEVLDISARLAAPSRGDDERNVQAHYDVSNEFFELMLDDTMTYSCGVFERPDASLRDAQLAKIDRLCSKLDLGPGDHLVEIGSGWGSFAVHAADRYGCRVTTTTVSAAQHSYVTGRVAEAGLSDRVSVLGDDWRDLRGRFDKLVSVEMIEAVDWRHHDDFLAACSALLADGGLAALQAIVIDDRSFSRAKWHKDFIRAMVFPGGCLPSVASITACVARATDLRIVDLEDIGRHYAETLQRWAANLDSHEAQLQRLKVSTEFRRLWALYLAYCEAAFLERHVSDVQVVLAKPSWRGRLSARAA